MIRTFIAFELPDEIKACLGEVISGLKQKNRAVKWVHPEGLHVTVKFLGSIDETLVEPLSRDLDGDNSPSEAHTRVPRSDGGFP